MVVQNGNNINIDHGLNEVTDRNYKMNDRQMAISLMVSPNYHRDKKRKAKITKGQKTAWKEAWNSFETSYMPTML